jgi:hypothetical protein
MKFTKMTPK